MKFVGILVALLPVVAAADFDAGCKAFERGDFAAALQEWQPLAEQGHAQAQFRLGCLFAYGQRVSADHQKALELFREAAEQGDADALNNLGGMYALGWGVENDLVEAYTWFELAAAKGLEIAARNQAFVAELLTPREVAEAEMRARQWAEEHR
jgi:hypothetical protein